MFSNTTLFQWSSSILIKEAKFYTFTLLISYQSKDTYVLVGGSESLDPSFPNNVLAVAFRNKTINQFEAAMADDNSLNKGSFGYITLGY